VPAGGAPSVPPARMGGLEWTAGGTQVAPGSARKEQAQSQQRCVMEGIPRALDRKPQETPSRLLLSTSALPLSEVAEQRIHQCNAAQRYVSVRGGYAAGCEPSAYRICGPALVGVRLGGCRFARSCASLSAHRCSCWAAPRPRPVRASFETSGLDGRGRGRRTLHWMRRWYWRPFNSIAWRRR
jgi:hypothetical protein